MEAQAPAREAKTEALTPRRAAKIVRIELTKGQKTETFAISKSCNDQVVWVGRPGMHFTVEFTNESPFYEKQFNNEFPYSGLVRREVLGDSDKKYKYIVHSDDGDIDPTGIIDP